VPALAPGRERSLPAVLPAVRKGRGWEATKGSNGAAQPSDVRNGRTRRGSDSHIRYDHTSVVIAEAPLRCASGRSQRTSYQTPRQRKLSHVQESAIRALAATKRLRSLAAEFGVSHETVRVICRRNN
jgi:hypothetical protein